MTLSNPFTHDPRVYNEAKSLTKAGHHITVLAWDRKKQNLLEEIKEDIDIIRIRNTRFMDFLPSDIFRLRFWWNEGYKESLELFKEKSFDIIHCHDLDTLPIGIKLKKKLNLPLIYDAHEIWPYVISGELPLFIVNYFFRKEKKLCSSVDHIITVNDLLTKYFNNISKCPISIVLNAKFLEYNKYAPTNNKIFTILCIGSIQESKLLINLIDVIEQVDNIKCIIGGIGHHKDYVNKVIEKCNNSKKCDFIGPVPREKVISMTRKADVVYCYGKTKNPKIKLPVGLPPQFAFPNRLFESLVAGRPCIVNKGAYSGIFIEEHKCGLAISQNNESLKNAILELKENPKLCENLGKKALKIAIEKYNWKKQEEILIEIYKKIN